MADLRAFRGFRYDLAKAGPLADLIAPPYDVIDSALQNKLYSASPHNAVRVELIKEETGDKYAKAAQTMRDWIDGGVLRQDSARSLYICEQEYRIENATHIRRGFFARVRLVPFGDGVFPHEQTLPGPKADRLSLYRATNFNLSPVFSLYPDNGSVFGKLESLMRRSPPLEATDHLGTVHRLWAVTDPATITDMIGLMGQKPVFIADGHHRYETGLKYLEEQRAAGEVPDNEHPANYCLMMLVGTNDPGLLIQPTHRLVSGLPNLSVLQLQEKLAPHFDLQSLSNARDCWDEIELEESQSTLGFGTASDQWLLTRLKNPTIMRELAPEQSDDWRGLGVSILHKLVLEKLLGGGACRYVHQLSEVTDAIAAKSCHLACLVPPATMDHVEAIAGRLEKMPPKSTYFYPKVPTGLVFHSLKKD